MYRRHFLTALAIQGFIPFVSNGQSKDSKEPKTDKGTPLTEKSIAEIKGALGVYLNAQKDLQIAILNAKIREKQPEDVSVDLDRMVWVPRESKP